MNLFTTGVEVATGRVDQTYLITQHWVGTMQNEMSFSRQIKVFMVFIVKKLYSVNLQVHKSFHGTYKFVSGKVEYDKVKAFP